MSVGIRRRPQALLVLLAGSAALLGALAVGREGLRATRWRLAQVWSRESPELLSSRVHTGRDAQGAAFVAARGEHALEVVDAHGRRRAHGTVTWGTRLAVGNTDGSPGDEIAVATFDDQPTIQVYDANLRVLGPSVTLTDVERAAGLALLDLDGDGRSELVVGDFSGCVSAMSYPTFLWDHCIDGSDAARHPRETGDPYALRDLVLVRTGKERHLLAARASGELLDLQPDGRRRWRSAGRFENLLGLWAIDFDGRGHERLLMISREAGWWLLDELGAEWAAGRPAGYLATAAPIEWDGNPRTTEVALAHDYGHLSVIDPHVRLEHAPAASAQILAFAAADVDADGRDELLAGTSMGRLELLVRSGTGFRQATHVAFGGELFAVLPWPAARDRIAINATEPHFVVVAGRQLSAYRADFMRGPALYSPLVASLLTALLLLLTWALLRFGGPSLPMLDERQ